MSINALSSHWEAFSGPETLPQPYQLFTAQTQDIAMEAADALRPMIAEMTAVGGYAELGTMHVETRPVSAWNIAGGALARLIKGDESASFAFVHQELYDTGRDVTYTYTDLIMRDERTAVAYRDRATDGVSQETSLTVFHGVHAGDVPADASLVNGFGTALENKRLGTTWDGQSDVYIPPIRADVSVSQAATDGRPDGSGRLVVVRRPPPRNAATHRRRGFSDADLDTIEYAVTTMESMADRVAGKVYDELVFLQRHPRLGRRMLSA